MSQNYNYPSSSNVTVTGIGNPTGQAVPSDAVYIAGEDPSLNLRGLQTDASGNLKVTIADAILTPLVTSDLADGPVTPGTVATKSILIGAQFNTVLPTLTTGQQAALQVDSSGRLIISPLTTASTLNINNISGTVSLPTGASTSALQTQISAQLPTTLGQKAMAASLAVTLASDQSNVNVTVATPLPAGSNTIGAVTQASGPWTQNLTEIGGAALALGQTTSVSSIPTVLASDQSAIPVTQSGTWTNTVTQATASNLNATVVQPTAANLNATVVQSTASSLNATVVQGTAANLKTASYASTPAALTVSQAALTVGTTAVRLTVSGSAPAATRAVLVATPDSASTAKFYIGSSTVTATGATRGVQIVAGQVFTANNDAGDYYIISDTAVQTVYVMEQA